ncbi:carboxypeptidase-like regulatory domain-containing protein [bacterium]|nr:carboxypeptidase-like regulatory domain-containing protein [bacterium]
MKLFASLCLVLLSTAFALGQSGTIKGTVTDSGMNGEPVLFANVMVKGTVQTVETNFHGNFEIENLKPGKYTLVVSYLGYETIELNAVVVENEITEINGGLNALSFSMADLEKVDGLSEKSVIADASTTALPKE